MDTFGRNFRISIFGESHGAGIGVVIDGVPAGLDLSEKDFEADIMRRRSGAFGTTPRHETDRPQILSGVLAGHTTGAPVAVTFGNEDTSPSDYELFKEIPRPGHADFAAGVKWHDFNDPRGGGHFSGRLTLPVVAAGTVAKKVLAGKICDLPDRKAASGALPEIRATVVEIGGLSRPDALERAVRNLGRSSGESPYYSNIPDENIGSGDPLQCHFSDSELWRPELEAAASDGDSLGGIVECVIRNIPAGVGEPFFDSVESLISHAVFSIPGVRGIEFGDGFRASRMRGSEHNDPLVSSEGTCSRNGAGGINGGLANGNPIVFRVAFKPASSIRKVQHTYSFTKGEVTELRIPGRHDVCFVLRTPVVVEAMSAIVLAGLV